MVGVAILDDYNANPPFTDIASTSERITFSNCLSLHLFHEKEAAQNLLSRDFLTLSPTIQDER